MHPFPGRARRPSPERVRLEDRPDAVSPSPPRHHHGDAVNGVDPVARALEQVRGAALSLPETNERLSHGAPTFFIRDRSSFVMFHDDHHGDGRLAIWCAAPSGVQGLVVDEDPRRFFVPPYVGHRGWLGLRLDLDVDWDEVHAVIEDAYRCVAPKRLLAPLDDGPPG